MTPIKTTRYQFQFIDPSQASQEVPHNLALVLNDAVTDMTVPSITASNTPPGSPANGDVYLTGSAATGAWSGQNSKIAVYYSGWYFLTRLEGMRAYAKDDDKLYAFNGTSWAQIAGSGSGGVGNWTYTEGEFSTTSASPTFFYDNTTLFTSGQTGQAIVECIVAGGNVGGAASTFGMRRKLFHVHYSGSVTTFNSLENVATTTAPPDFTITQSSAGFKIGTATIGSPGTNSKFKWSVKVLKGTDNTY